MGIISKLAEVPKKFKELADNFAGSAYVLLILWVGGIIVLLIDYFKRTGHVRFDLQQTLEVFAVAVPLTIAMYRLGTFLDDWLFDPSFEPKTDTALLWGLGSEMRKERAKAALFLESGRKNWKRECKTQREGIYRRATKLYGEKTSQWKDNIKRPLEISKAARCFIIPFLLVFVYDFWPGFLPRLTASDNVFRAFTFLAEPWTMWASFFLAVVMLFLYVKLRLVHMRKLYAFVSDSEFKFASVTIPSIGETAEFLCEGCVLLISRSEIRQIVRKECNVENSFPTLFSNELHWQTLREEKQSADGS